MTQEKNQKINTVPSVSEQFFAGKPDDPNLRFFAGVPSASLWEQEERVKIPSASTHDFNTDLI